ncbi:glyoxylase-like metal-dependent hydrolase (beta-lactamase superfamily II) [Lederbergia wuyishanensis]|uniref:Glyoxylase-like metal-dependent hydrolase (Beta-lactamase superfamily II) n=2 Tax=Lederbergia wuyishanensis TaxID=1347903 RepID=A0ABU0D5B8_9BACI|nr:glyoxylase-like metal-dependent hydrolase (beta-lactamase superfamily II) [Lederbergia wuyishanensis]
MNMEYGEDYKYIPVTSINSGIGQEIEKDIYGFTIQVVNIYFVGDPQKNEDWFLIDTGMPKSSNIIIEEAEKRYGPNTRPKAIILTHGHFDHVGACIDLVEHWKVPVYAHELELPFLSGEQSYPEPDTTVEGGLVAKISSIFPNEPINLGKHVYSLPKDGTVPGLSDWRWIHTPGHSPGHISLFREKDRTLIAGDAFITVRQDSLYKVLMQKEEINGPPRYLTTDWNQAWESVKILENIKPTVALTGHGSPVSGDFLAKGLSRLVREFDSVAIPDYGKYLK